jgi:hypothetical protein
MDALICDAANETIKLLYQQAKRKKNKKRIDYLIQALVGSAISRIQPYMYAIMGVLVILFLMNCFQFYYYIKMANWPDKFTTNN